MSLYTPDEFDKIEYDLSQNLLSFEKETIISLKDHSFILCVAQLFRDTNKNSLLEWMKYHKKVHEGNCGSAEMLLERVEVSIYTAIQLNGLDGECMPKDKISFMAVQVCDFIFKHDSEFNNTEFQDAIFTNLYFTSHGTINISETVARILKTTDISVAKKFAFICIDPETLSDYYYKFCIFRETLSGENYLIFWKITCLHMKGSPEKKEIIGSFLKNAVENNNEIAVQYIWTKYISNMNDEENFPILKSMLEEKTLNFKSINIFMYLIFQIKSARLQYFITPLYEIVTELIKSIRWRPHYLRIFHLFKCIKPLDIIGLVTTTTVVNDFSQIDYICKDKSELLRDFFQSLTKDEQKNLAHQLFDLYRNNEKIKNLILKSFIEEREDFVKLLLRASNCEDFAKFLYSQYGETLILRIRNEKKTKFFTETLDWYFKGDNLTNLKRKVMRL